MAELKNFILEIGVEELPARLLSGISNHIKNEITSLLSESEVGFSNIETSYTPRRLFFSIEEMQAESPDKDLEVKGPPEKIAKDGDKYTGAALGFAKKNNVEEKDLFIKDGYLYAKAFQKGVSAAELLEAELPKIISNVPGERFMRTQDGDMKFSRPLRWIVALLGDKTLDFKVETLKSGSKSYGHRFLAPDAFDVSSKDQYTSELEKRGVYLDIEKRKEVVITKSKELAKSIGGEVLIEDDLLEEVVNLIENPAPILCSFDEKFLKIPKPVTITVMSVHQRYFPVMKDDELLPNFIAVSNNPLKEAEKNIREGNEKVIVPRLKDGEFFFDEDNKISLEDRLEKLEKINFQSGTMRQKVERIESIAKYVLTEELEEKTFSENPAKADNEKLDQKTIDTAIEAAKLCKSDLTSQLVFEFTELQGEIGGIYAKHQGKDPMVADAIYDHYKPRYAGDELPRTLGSKVVAIADKLDSLVIMFGLGKVPKGSADPFALRRQANGLLEIILHSHLIINVDRLVDKAIDIAKAQMGNGRMITKTKGRGEKRETIEVPEFDWEFASKNLKEFLLQRLEFVFEMNHKDTEVNKAVLSTGKPLAELNKKHMMIHFVMSLKATNDFPKFVEAAGRVLRIRDAKFAQLGESDIDKSKFVNGVEGNLLDSFINLEHIKTDQVINDIPLKDSEVFSVVEPINKFFDNVLVNDEDEAVKKNRHALINRCSAVLEEMADFQLL